MPTVPGRRVCCWCNPHHDIGPAPGLKAGEVTHTACEAARDRALAELEKLTAKISACVHGTPSPYFCNDCYAQNEEKPR
jgi:hypothetical protein